MSRKRKGGTTLYYVHAASGRFTVRALSPYFAAKHIALVNNEVVNKVEKKRD